MGLFNSNKTCQICGTFKKETKWKMGEQVNTNTDSIFKCYSCGIYLCYLCIKYISGGNYTCPKCGGKVHLPGNPYVS